MKIDEELKNFWNDEEKVKRVEKQLSKEELNYIAKKANKKEEPILNFKENNKEEPILNISNSESKKINTLGLLILGILFIISIFMTYFVYSVIKEKNQSNENFTKELERMNGIGYTQNTTENKEENLILKRNHLKLDNNIYSNNLYTIQNKIYNTYKDIEFIKNLEPFFNNLTTIVLPANDKIYEFEIKGILSRYGNFSYIIYKRTNIIEYDNEVIRELERLKKIKFREQKKDIDFSLTITNRYKLIN
ncbi:MAG: hypothetical protein RBR70_05300 [Arcobacter sp.]|jgi:hypothetical protein|uniref:hypothetical protein n=1 Tax=Arcobacter sp. TaxID=1872629 RepID=UPI002A75AFA6|nr:hypothetical protein [Arcobacter sp.]MDY3204469.1 hypothetical protein [Arcobacter sp.]